jgi:branched-chain amino acid transport system substrate-binding protein
MRHKSLNLTHWLAIAALLLGACAPATTAAPTAAPATAAPTEPPAQAATSAPDPTAAPTEAPAAEPKTLVIGFSSSQTGATNVESVAQTNGFNLWLKAVNDAGGITLSDGTVVTFQAVSYDDESNKDRVQELYTKLATEDNADFLISPYSSGLTDAAAVIAEQYGKIMITTGASSDSTHKKGYTHVYMTYTPASFYLKGAVDLLGNLDPSVKKVAIVHENDKFSTDVGAAVDAYAKSNGFEVVLLESYDSKTTDFAPFINKIVASAPDAILGGGHYADTSTFSKQLFEKGVTAKFIALLVAPASPKFAELGDAAVGIVGPSQWEPQAQYSAEAAQAAGIAWVGPSVAEFVEAYKAAYEGNTPSYHAAGGYAAGLILQTAIQKADSVEPAKVKEALNDLNIMTFFGGTKYDTSPEQFGLQIGHSMVYIQWQKDGSGQLVKQVVWPEAGKSAEALYPAR